MSVQSTEGTVASEQSASTQSGETNSFANSLLAEAKASGHDIGDIIPDQPQDEAEVTPEAEPETTEQEQTEEQPEEQQEEVEQAPEPEHKSIDDQIKEAEAKGEKPPWYLSRIADETRKRKERDTQIEKLNTVSQGLYTENQQLKQQLTQASAPRPSAADPLADIFDDAGLERVSGVYRSVIRLAELNPDGAYDIPIKQSDGTEVRKDFTKEQLIDMKLDAQEMLQNGIPRRRAYLSKRIEADTKARQSYPELNDPQSGWVQMGQQFLRNMPELQRDPECWTWIARALRGWSLEQQGKNGEQKVNPKDAATKIVESAKVKKAPILPAARGFTPRKGADLDKAKKQMEERGDAQSAEKLLESLGVGGGPKSKRQQYVEA